MAANPRRASLEIPSLDGMRALAVMVVFVAHAGAWFIPGNFGVTIFFFLSGYLITTLLRVELERHGRLDIRAFYLRRFLRILPPFYLVLAVATAFTAAHLLEGWIDPTALVAQALHLTNYWVIAHGWWDGRAPGTWIYWSLAVEEHFYLAFPLLFALMSARLSSRGRQALVLAGLCAAVLAWRLVLVFVLHQSRDREYIASDTRIDSILFGCILAVWGNPALERPILAGRGLALAVAGAGALLLVTFAIHHEEFEQTFRYTLQGIALFPIFIAVITWHQAWPFSWLNAGWVKHVGVLSYPIYLLHPTVLYAAYQWLHLPVLGQAVVGLVASVLLAEAIHRLVERPCAVLRRRLSRTAASAPAADAAARVPASAVA